MKKNIPFLILFIISAISSNAQTLLKDIHAGGAPSNPGKIFSLNGSNYFMAEDGVFAGSMNIYKVENNGATLISTTEHSEMSNLFEFSSKCYYQAYYYNSNGDIKNGFFEFDGTNVKELILDQTDSSAQVNQFFNIDNKLLVRASQVHGQNGGNIYELNSSTFIKTFPNVNGDCTPYKDTLYFLLGSKGSPKATLYYADMRTQGRVIKSSTASLDFNRLLGEWNGDFYAIVEGAAKNELWKINGTPSKIGDVGTKGASVTPHVTKTATKMFFRGADDNTNGCIYMYNGTTITNASDPSVLGDATDFENTYGGYVYIESEDKLYFLTESDHHMHSMNFTTNVIQPEFSKLVAHPMVLTDNDKLCFVHSPGNMMEDHLYRLSGSSIKRLTDSAAQDWTSLKLMGNAGDQIIFSGWDQNASTDVGIEPYMVELSTASIHKVRNAKNVVVYPNPATTHLNVDMHDVDKVEILDMKGGLVLASDNASALEIEHLQNGLYLVLVRKGSEKYSTRFIKQ